MSDWVTVKSKKSRSPEKGLEFIWNGPVTVYKGPLHSDNRLEEGLCLLKMGAKWGDLEVYTIEENIEILQEKEKEKEVEIMFGC
jgi:hypothetical protein